MHKHLLAIVGAGALAFGGHHAFTNNHKKFLADGVDEHVGRPHLHHPHIQPLSRGWHHRR